MKTIYASMKALDLLMHYKKLELGEKLRLAEILHLVNLKSATKMRVLSKKITNHLM